MRGYDAGTFRDDVFAGVTVGLVAMPLAIAFGIASGVTPQAGLYTAIVGGFIVSAFGGSRLQIGGPTGAFVIIVAGIVATHGTSGLLVVTTMAGVILRTIALRFGAIPAGPPHFEIPQFRPDLILPLLPSAMTVALLAAVESLLSAVVADSLTGDRHDSRVELVAQGLANIAVPFFGGIPVTGAIARTATNVRSGARTPVSGIVHACVLLAIVTFFTPLASTIPLAALAAILMLVAWNMGEWREIGTIVRLDNAARSVWLVDGRAHILADKFLPAFVSIVRIHGPFLFGATESLSDRTADLEAYGQVVILRLRNMTAIDATGMRALEGFYARVERSGRTLLLCGARDQPARFLLRARFVETIGAANILPNVGAALARAETIHASAPGNGHLRDAK